jgi:large subunit ribosomal protein L7/L12
MFRRALLTSTRSAAASLRGVQSSSTRGPAAFFSPCKSENVSFRPVQTKLFSQQRYFSSESEEQIPLPPATSEKAVLDSDVERIVEDITKLNLLQVSQLVSELKERLGLPDQAPMAAMPMGMGMPMGAVDGGAAAGEAAAPVEEKTEFDVKLTGFDDKSKIKVIKEVRALTGLGLKEAKAAVDAVPNVLTQGLKKEEAEEWMEKIKAAGGHCELE